MSDRNGFLASLDVLAARVAAKSPGAVVAIHVRVPDDGWAVTVNGKALFLGATVADLIAADADFDAVQGGIGLVLRGAPHGYQDGRHVDALARAGGPVADA